MAHILGGKGDLQASSAGIHEFQHFILQVALIAETVNAWIVSKDQQEGIFDRSFDKQGIKQAARMADPDSLEDDSLYHIVSDVEDLKAHHLWVNFLLEAWQVETFCSKSRHFSLRGTTVLLTIRSFLFNR